MDLSVTTDYATDRGNPEPYLRRIAEAGFTHIHWCHHWCTDFLYSRWEIDQIEQWLKDYGLRLLDLHASAGREKNWGSQREYERLAGLELVRNRIAMAAQLGSGVIIMHAPGDSTPELYRQSLNELRVYALEHGVRIAIENGNMSEIGEMLSECDADYVGLCYDAGHGNMAGDGLDMLEQLKDRLISVHLHDNDGAGDLHNPLFSGTGDWERLAGIMAASSYDKCVSMEVTMPNSGIEDEAEFLRQAFDTGKTFTEMIDAREKASAS